MRITTSVVLFYVWLTASANLIQEVGWTSSIGISGTTSVGDTLSGGIAEINSINAGNLVVESLISVYLTVATAIEAFLTGLTAGPRLMLNIGMPLEFVAFIHAPLALLGGRYLIYAVSGREL